MKFILSGTFEQYITYLRANNLNPREHRRIDECGVILMGTINPQVEKIGTWHELEHLDKIEQMILQRSNR